MHAVIPAGTGAATKEAKINHPPASIVASNLAGSETVIINIKDADGGYVEVAELTATDPTTALYAAGTYQFVKSSTAGACSVGIANSTYDV